MNEIYALHMGKAVCAVDLGDGSERGEYVDQDYILQTLGRPHRSISLMYCYYPNDPGFPGRASVVHADPSVSFAWDYPYDDYFPYTGGLNGSTDGEPFRQMREIRAHGQDVTLTLTIDPHLSDAHLAAIGRDLRPFGRVFLRINHEATGDWFSFTKRATYREIADFFVRAANLIRQEAPNVQVIICIGGVEHPETGRMEKEDEFAQTIPAADIWSVDKYMALHWGWPYDVAEPGGTTHGRSKVRDIYELTRLSFERFRALNGGKAKPMVMSECNADGDVTGPYEQAAMLQEFCDILEEEQADWFTGFTFYQFRDRGRLGLEMQDPNNAGVGIPQPVLHTYRQIIHAPRFLPQITQGEAVQLPVTLRWGNSEDAEGLAIPLYFEKNPVLCELTFTDEGNYLLELNGRWFYRSPAAKVIDLMPAFFDNPLAGSCTLTLKLFAPPASGENDLSLPDGLYQSYTTVETLPQIRIRFAPIEP